MNFNKNYQHLHQYYFLLIKCLILENIVNLKITKTHYLFLFILNFINFMYLIARIYFYFLFQLIFKGTYINQKFVQIKIFKTIVNLMIFIKTKCYYNSYFLLFTAKYDNYFFLILNSLIFIKMKKKFYKLKFYNYKYYNFKC